MKEGDKERRTMPFRRIAFPTDIENVKTKKIFASSCSVLPPFSGRAYRRCACHNERRWRSRRRSLCAEWNFFCHFICHRSTIFVFSFIDSQNVCNLVRVFFRTLRPPFEIVVRRRYATIRGRRENVRTKPEKRGKPKEKYDRFLSVQSFCAHFFFVLLFMDG